MKYSLLLVSFAFVFSLSSAVNANKTFVCENGSSVREVALAYDTPNVSVPCRVVYKKGETETTLWQAQNEQGYCEAKAAEFVAKLGETGWNCVEKPAEGAVE